MASIRATERNRAMGFVAPALLWVLAFFIIPFAVMIAMSFARLDGCLQWNFMPRSDVRL